MYIPAPGRYAGMEYRRCGESGLLLPAISLGFWHNFGAGAHMEEMKNLCRTAFDLGITHFDLADNYGPPPGSAEIHFGRILKEDFAHHRDELVIATKAGHPMWPGPYGDWGGRKHLLAGLDQSLKRMGLDYVDIFYHHRMDPQTPLEETMEALSQAVRSGKALYVGLSKYDGPTLERSAGILKELHCPFVVSQQRWSLLDRTVEKNGGAAAAKRLGKGIIAFTPLAQGLLTDRYLSAVPGQCCIRRDGQRVLRKETLTPQRHGQLLRLGEVAASRGQTLSELALSWLLHRGDVTSVLVGASRPEQLTANVKALQNTAFTEEELRLMDEIAPL